MKTIQLSIILASLFATNAFAQYYPPQNTYPAPSYTTQTFTDYAKVRHITPEYQNINQPQVVCNDEVISEPIPQNNHNYGGTAIGGIAGGLLGNQIGGGNGRTAATALGAVTGALIGDNMGNNQQPQYQQRTISHCSNINHYNQILTGYRVEYEYRGQINTVVTQNPPTNNRIKLNLQATPDLK